MTPPIVLTGTVVGEVAVVQRLGVRAPAQARQRIKVATMKLGFQLQRLVVTQQLNGGVLQRRSGRLARSINTRFADTATASTASVGTNLLYGRVWELTGSKAFTMRPKIKKALMWAGAPGGHPWASANHPAQAARPFLKPALRQMRPQIHATYADAMKGL